MIKKIAKNELKKSFRTKSFYILIIFLLVLTVLSAWMYNDIKQDVLSDTGQADYMTEEDKIAFLNINANKFLSMFITDFIYKAAIPFFAIFMVIFSVSTFATDYTSGNLKFTLLEVNNYRDVLFGKILYIFIFTTLNVIISLVLGLGFGIVIFGTSGMVLKDTIVLIFLHGFAIIPIASFAILVGVIFLISNKHINFTIVGIVISILISMLDHFTISENFSPLSIIMKFKTTDIIDITYLDLLQFNLISLGYLVLAVLIGINIFKKKEWIY